VGISYLIDLRADPDWIKLVREFEDELVKRLGGRLRRVVARSSPDDLVYESNVFVFVDSVDMDVMREVAKAALEVQKRLGMEGLSPMTVREGEILDSSTAQEKMRDEDWIKLVREFEDELVKRLGGRLRRVVARSSPDDLVYESNVFVFVDSVDMDVMREVAKAALEVQKRLGMEGLSPMTVREGEIELRKG